MESASLQTCKFGLAGCQADQLFRRQRGTFGMKRVECTAADSGCRGAPTVMAEFPVYREDRGAASLSKGVDGPVEPGGMLRVRSQECRVSEVGQSLDHGPDVLQTSQYGHRFGHQFRRAAAITHQERDPAACAQCYREAPRGTTWLPEFRFSPSEHEVGVGELAASDRGMGKANESQRRYVRVARSAS